MSEPDYPWPHYRTGPNDHLHALGVISLNFNLYELALIIYAEEHFDKQIAEYIFSTMTNEERVGLIRRLAEWKEPDPDAREAIDFSLSHFMTCAENRHNLLHSRLQISHKTVLTLEKAARGNPEKLLQFHLKIGALRRVADEMMAGFNYILRLWDYFRARQRYLDALDLHEEGLVADPPKGQPPALPDKPPSPRKIDPLPPA